MLLGKAWPLCSFLGCWYPLLSAWPYSVPPLVPGRWLPSPKPLPDLRHAPRLCEREAARGCLKAIGSIRIQTTL